MGNEEMLGEVDESGHFPDFSTLPRERSIITGLTGRDGQSMHLCPPPQTKQKIFVSYGIAICMVYLYKKYVVQK